MPEEKKSLPQKAASAHKIIIDKRENATVSGVVDVISFDEDSVTAETEQGVIVIKGVNLHVNSINLDSGLLEIDGGIDSVNYEESGLKGKGSLFGKIFK